jgi:hypothetical protein
MALLRGGGYGHHVRRITADTYAISWHYDTKYGRLRYPRTINRITDRKGAERFAKRWGVPVPPEPLPCPQCTAKEGE